MSSCDGSGVPAARARPTPSTAPATPACCSGCDLEEPIAGAIPVLAGTQLVITEGNYLLLDDGPWARVAGLLDEVWYVDIDDRLRNERLVQRHEHFGRSRDAALAWVAGTDEPNARLIAATRPRAHRVFHWRED
jgi:pantothenate kinase